MHAATVSKHFHDFTTATARGESGGNYVNFEVDGQATNEWLPVGVLRDIQRQPLLVVNVTFTTSAQ